MLVATSDLNGRNIDVVMSFFVFFSYSWIKGMSSLYFCKFVGRWDFSAENLMAKYGMMDLIGMQSAR